MMRRTLVVLVVLAGAGYGAAEVAAKNYAEKALAESAAAQDPIAEEAEAEVSAPLLWGLITRNTIDRIEISTRHVTVGPFIADRTVAVLTGVHLDRAASLREFEAVVSSIDRLDMTVEISAAEASKVLPEGFAFEFVGGGVVAIRGPGVSVRGRLVVAPPSAVRFEPEAGVRLPRGFSPPRWEFEDIPFVTCIREIEILPGRARVTCSQENPPPTFPP